MARVLGVRANTRHRRRRSRSSGLLAARRGDPAHGPDRHGLADDRRDIVLFAFIATIVGGMGSLPGAVLGGFSLGALTVVLQASLPLDAPAVPRRVRVRRGARRADRAAAGAAARALRARARGPAAADLRAVARRLRSTRGPAPARKAVARAGARRRPLATAPDGGRLAAARR